MKTTPKTLCKVNAHSEHSVTHPNQGFFWFIQSSSHSLETTYNVYKAITSTSSIQCSMMAQGNFSRMHVKTGLQNYLKTVQRCSEWVVCASTWCCLKSQEVLTTNIWVLKDHYLLLANKLHQITWIFVKLWGFKWDIKLTTQIIVQKSEFHMF